MINKVLYLFLFVLFIVPQILSAEIDTLSRFSRQHTPFLYSSADIVGQGIRVDMQREGTLKSVGLLINTTKDTSALRVRILGAEKGSSYPKYNEEIINSIKHTVIGKGTSIQWVELATPIHIAHKQFFIIIDYLDKGISVMSDTVPKNVTCISELGEKFTSQLILTKSSGYKKTSFAPYIAVVIDYIDKDKSIEKHSRLLQYSKDTVLKYHLFNNKINSACVRDINSDNKQDLLIDGILYVTNSENSTLEEINLLDSSVHLSFFIDYNKDGIEDICLIRNTVSDNVMILVKSKYFNVQNRFDTITFTATQVKQPRCFTVIDLDKDGYEDVFLGQYTSDEHNTSSVILLNKQKYNNGFEIIPLTKYKTTTSCGIHSTASGKVSLYIRDEQIGDVSYSINNYEQETINTLKDRVHTQESKSYGFFANYLHGSLYTELAPKFLPVKYLSIHSYDQTITISDNNETNTVDIPEEDMYSGGLFTDLDNDGMDEILLPTYCSCRHGVILKNTDKDVWVDISRDCGISEISGGREVITFDIDNDGDQEIMCLGNEREPKLFINTQNNISNKFRKIKLSSKDNESIIGSVIEIYTNKKKYKELVTGGRGNSVQDPKEIIMSLENEDEKIDSIVVQWYNDSSREAFKGDSLFGANRIELVQRNNSDEEDIIIVGAKPNPFLQKTEIEFSTRSDRNVCFKVVDLEGKSIQNEHCNYYKRGNNLLHWDGKNKDGLDCSEGQYLLLIYSDDSSSTMVVNLLKRN